MFLFCWVFGLRHSNSGACRLWGRAKSWWQNGNLRKISCRSIFSRASATSVVATSVSSSWHLPPSEDPPRFIGKFSPGSCGFSTLCWVPVYVKPCVHPPRMASLFPQIYGGPALKPHWPFKSKMFWGFILLMPDPQAEKPSVGFRAHSCGRTCCDIIIVQFMCCPPGRYRIYVMKVSPPSTSLWLFSLSLNVKYLSW